MNTRPAAACAATLLTTAIVVAGAGPLRSGTIATAAPASTAYAEGAPAGFSGGFGQASCHGCHFHEAINSTPGHVAVTGVPDRFVAGQPYRLIIALERPGMRLGGFQLTARFKEGGGQAGALAPGPGEEARVSIATDGEIQYAGHKRPGAVLTEPDTASWSLTWTAPSALTPVVFHLAANAADGDETVEGDYVYTTAIEAEPDR